jgi:hypothetical protein
VRFQQDAAPNLEQDSNRIPSLQTRATHLRPDRVVVVRAAAADLLEEARLRLVEEGGVAAEEDEEDDPC